MTSGMTRRGLLRCLAAGFFPTVPGRPAPVAAGVCENAAPPIVAVIYDERHRDAKVFAARLRRDGAVAFPAGGDSAGLWYGELATLLRRHGGRVAGLTSYADFVVARSCGREQALRLVFEASCSAPDRPGHLTRWLLEPRAQVAQ